MASPAVNLKRKRVRAVLDRLSASIRGQIFLCNMDAGIQLGLLAANRISKAISTIKLRDINVMHENTLLGHLKGVLQDPVGGLILQNDRSSAMPPFAAGKPLVTVITRKDFEQFYAYPPDLISGHDFANYVPGAYTTRFGSLAATKGFFWAAPTSSFSSSFGLTRTAEVPRDALGLVHYGKGIALVALHLTPPPTACYRPTVLEANPNARFRQNNPNAPHETRWGFTVDLALLDGASPPASISGKPELLLAGFPLNQCASVMFYHLGTTLSDRDTASADERFLAHLLSGQSMAQLMLRLRTGLLP